MGNPQVRQVGGGVEMPMRLARRGLILVVILSAVVLLISGNAGGTASYPVYGLVTEEDTGITLVGAVVRMGPEITHTNAEGSYWLEVPKGVHEFEVSLDGYHPYLVEINLDGSREIAIGLETELPKLQAELVGLYDSLGQPLGVQGSTDCPMTFLQVEDYTQLLGANAEIGRLELYLNGQWYPLSLPTKPVLGPLEFPVPLHPGRNDFQLRVWDNRGWARSLPPYAVELTWDVLAFRAVLSCDAPAGLELHVFQRAPGEPNLFDRDSQDRHIYWLNRTPGDFGTTPEQNPFLDWHSSFGEGILASIALREAVPGDYHIWIQPSTLTESVTAAVLTVDLDATLFALDRRVFRFELTREQQGEPIYAATVHVGAEGIKTVTSVDPQQ